MNQDEELVSARFLADPYPFYTRWRDETPVWWSDRMDGWMVSRYDDVRRVLGNYKGYGQSAYFESGLVHALGTNTVVAMNPPEHTDLRRKAEPIFRPTQIEKQLEEFIADVVSELVDNVAKKGVFEFTADITTPLVMRTMAELMGTGQSAELEDLYRGIHAYIKSTRYHVDDEAVAQAGLKAGSELMTYLRQRAGEGHSPLYSALSAAGITDLSALATCGVVLLAGVETTVRGLASTVYALVMHPDQMAVLRSDYDLATKAFDEGLRWITPLQLKAREAQDDLEFGEVTIRKGDTVFPVLGAANRDERHYDQPDNYDVRRRASDHVAFGSGIHYCIGAPVAKLEARTVLTQLLQRFPGLRLDDRAIEWDGPIYRSPRELWLRTDD